MERDDCFAAAAHAERYLSKNDMSKIITRSHVLSILEKWQQGLMTPQEVNEWAGHLYPPGEVDYADWEMNDKVSITNEVLAALDMMDINLRTIEDIPAFVEFLNTPIDQFEHGYQNLEKYLQSINLEIRKIILAKDSFYEGFCK